MNEKSWKALLLMRMFRKVEIDRLFRKNTYFPLLKKIKIKIQAVHYREGEGIYERSDSHCQ